MRSALGCVALGVGLLLVAGTFDAEPLYVTGSALALLGLGAIGWIGIGSRGARIERTLGARSVQEEQPLEVRVQARGGSFGLPPGTIDEPLLGDPVPVRAGRSRAAVRVEATFARRGQRKLPPPVLVLRDPLGLVVKTIHGAGEDEVLVLPRVEPLLAARPGGEEGSAGARAALLAAAEVEIDGLRPYREGAPASRIHWATVARGRGLMERKLIAEADTRPIIVLDPRTTVQADADAAVRAAASLTVHFARQSGVALLLPGDRRATVIERDLAAWSPMHVRLALLGSDAGPPLAVAQNRRGVVVYVSARPVERPPRTIARAPGGLILVVPGELPGRRPLFSVAGCSGYAHGRPGSTTAAAAAAALGGAA